MFVPSPAQSNLPVEGEVRSFEYQDPAVNTAAFTAFTAPTIGTSLILLVAATLPFEPGAVFFGINPTVWPFGMFGFVLVPNEFPGLSKFFFTDSIGAAAVSLGIPNDPLLVGLSFFTQSLTADGLTNALAITVGL